MAGFRFTSSVEPRVAEDHTGITGAMLNVRIYKALQALPSSKASKPSKASPALKR